MKLRKINFISPSFGAFLLILIGSPALSITKSLTNVFLPNEKIAFAVLIFIIFKLKNNLHKNFKKLLIYTNILFGIYLIFFSLREIIFEIPIEVPNINNFLGLLSTILFASYLSFFKKDNITKLLFYTLSFQLIIVFMQIIFIITNNLQLFNLLNNYYSQCFVCEGFIFPVTKFLTPRVPGLFNEASGLSSFSAFCLIYSISNSKFGRKFKFIPKFFENDYSLMDKNNILINNLLLIFSFLGLFFSFSNTGNLMVFIYSFFIILEVLNNGFGQIKLKYIITTIAFSVLLIKLQTLDLIKSTFTTSTRADWTYQTISNIINSSDINFFIGSAAIWDGASWDSITRFIQIFGLLGSIPLWITIWYLVFSRNILFCLCFIPLFLTNAQFSMPHSIIILGFIILLNFQKSEKFLSIK